MSAPLSSLAAKRYTKLSAQFELITPAFVGGFEHECVGLDPKSIKAALRFWWRVLNSGHIAHNCSNNANLHDLHKRERRLFGVEGGERKNDKGEVESCGGQGLLHLVLRSTMPKPARLDAKFVNDVGIKYLLGQGILEGMAEHHRYPLLKGKFDLDLIFLQPKELNHARQDSPDTADVESVMAALKAFGLLGGLGGRKNRGFGSVALLKIGENHFTPSPEDYIEQLRKIFAPQEAMLASEIPLLPSISAHVKCRVLHGNNEIFIPAPATKNGHQPLAQRDTIPINANDPMSMLSLIGEQFLLERGWGFDPYRKDEKKKGQVHWVASQKIAEQNYEEDHKLIKAALRQRREQPPLNAIPKRSIYGLPYLFGEAGGMNVMLPGDTAKGEQDQKGRRGSPFHIHIHTVANQTLAVLYTLPSKFLPDDLQINIDNLPPRNTNTLDFDYSTIDNFLNRFSSADIIKK